MARRSDRRSHRRVRRNGGDRGAARDGGVKITSRASDSPRPSAHLVGDGRNFLIGPSEQIAEAARLRMISRHDSGDPTSSVTTILANGARASAPASLSAAARIGSSLRPDAIIRLDTHSVRQSSTTHVGAAPALRARRPMSTGSSIVTKVGRAASCDEMRCASPSRSSSASPVATKEAVTLIRVRELQRVRAFAAARAAGDQRDPCPSRIIKRTLIADARCENVFALLAMCD